MKKRTMATIIFGGLLIASMAQADTTWDRVKRFHGINSNNKIVSSEYMAVGRMESGCYRIIECLGGDNEKCAANAVECGNISIIPAITSNLADRK